MRTAGNTQQDFYPFLVVSLELSQLGGNLQIFCT